jgi:hypothetical protein
MRAPSPSQLPRPIPYGLWSLWDMLRKVDAAHLVELGVQIAEGVDGLDEKHGSGRLALSERLQSAFEAVHRMAKLCKTIKAKETGALLDTRVEYWPGLGPDTGESMEILVDAFKKELSKRQFFYMPEAEFYQDHRILTREAKDAFPKLAQELRSAGNAYACGLPTACVFHCMRALEHALQAMALDCGLMWTKEQWHNIIEQIDATIDRQRDTLQRGVAKDERLHGLSKAAKEFFYFKDGWRNYVSHKRVSYEPEQATEVLEHVRAFTEHLAKELKLKEQE